MSVSDLRRRLIAEAWGVDCPDSLDAALTELQSPVLDAMIVDVDEQGTCLGVPATELCRRVRATGSFVGVLARLPDESGLSDRLAMLRAGADDCLTAHTDPAEVCARLAAVCRRSQRPVSDSWRFPWGRLDPIRLSFVGDRSEVDLTAQAFRIMSCLIYRWPEPVSASDVATATFRAAPGADSSALRNQITTLRKALAACQLTIVSTPKGYAIDRLEVSRKNDAVARS